MTSRLLVFSVLSASLCASASDRQLTYAYTSNVLNPGDAEIEPWTTVRAGREAYFFLMQNSVEVEFGVTERYQASFYVHAQQGLADVLVGGRAQRQVSSSFQGVSFANKWKLLDATADAVGLALYVEPYLRAGEVELEGKLIVDKRLGDLLLVGNLVVEHEWNYQEAGALKTELKVEAVLGAAYTVFEHFSVGLEARSHNAFETGEVHTALFLGPSLAWRGRSSWVAFTVLPQLASFTQPGLDLEDHERVEARLLLGFHL